VKIYRRRIEDLSASEARQIVREMRQILFPRRNVGEQWSSDTPEALGYVLAEHRLTPTNEAFAAAEQRESDW
jgi:hypothetical protein